MFGSWRFDNALMLVHTTIYSIEDYGVYFSGYHLMWINFWRMGCETSDSCQDSLIWAYTILYPSICDYDSAGFDFRTFAFALLPLVFVPLLPSFILSRTTVFARYLTPSMSF